MLAVYTKYVYVLSLQASIRSLAPAYAISVVLYMAVGLLLGANPLRLDSQQVAEVVHVHVHVCCVFTAYFPYT